jgi:hypothetical protein
MPFGGIKIKRGREKEVKCERKMKKGQGDDSIFLRVD